MFVLQFNGFIPAHIMLGLGL